MEKEKKKLKERIGFRIVMVLAISICVAVIILTLYLFNGEVVSEVPAWFEENYVVKTTKIEGRKVFTIQKKGKEETDKTIIYIHGGSYMAELQKEHWAFFSRVLEDCNATFIVPDYPLAPKYHCKDVFEMMEPFYEKIIGELKGKEVIVMGDSAGAGLALALMEEIGEKQLRQPDKLILISPWLDTTMSNPLIDDVQEKDSMLSKAGLKLAGENYSMIGKENKDYLANPLFGPLENINHVTVFTGTYDILNPDVSILKKKLKDLGKEVEVKEYEKAIHNFILFHMTKENILFGEEGYQELLKIVENKI